jgi:glutathione S-transferase
VITIYDAPRCPYCARVRIVLAEKRIPWESIVVDLENRPTWIYEKNPSGKVPVLEEDGFVLPESHLIMEYLEERYPEPALLPPDAEDRALARLAVDRFDDLLGDDYYAFRRGEGNRLEERLETLPLGRSLYVDAAYAPWIMRARVMLGLELPPDVAAWLGRMVDRPEFAEELDVVASLAAAAR